jgi:hypothetical protein
MNLETIQTIASTVAVYIGWVNSFVALVLAVGVIVTIRRPFCDVLGALAHRKKIKTFLHGLLGISVVYILGELRWVSLYVKGVPSPLDDLFWSVWELGALTVVSYLVALMAVGPSSEKE